MRKVSGRYLEGVRKLSGRCFEKLHLEHGVHVVYDYEPGSYVSMPYFTLFVQADGGV